MSLFHLPEKYKGDQEFFLTFSLLFITCFNKILSLYHPKLGLDRHDLISCWIKTRGCSESKNVALLMLQMDVRLYTWKLSPSSYLFSLPIIVLILFSSSCLFFFYFVSIHLSLLQLRQKNKKNDGAYTPHFPLKINV